MLFPKRFFFIPESGPVPVPLLLIWLFFIIFSFSLSGCSQTSAPEDDGYIIKTSAVTITADDFADELELKRAAYPYTIKDDPYAYNQLVLSLVKMLTEEAILLTAAEALGVQVSDAELEQAVAEFKADYPEDSFDLLLLENAISYAFWRHRFKKHLVMDKLIDQELRQKIEITPEDIVRFYERYQSGSPGTDADQNTSMLQQINDEKELVSRLRMEKTQERYEAWIQKLFAQYPIQINNKQLTEFLISDPAIEETQK